ncbi:MULTISPECIES: DUF7511 domain-containing protein [Haloarcula]|uniref:DUF7511 domain-containing protein n=1 Tax=Haloarcula TaxID=2237 RepID=UPI0023EAE94B|nr:hypothetical protein [Halomicroarcula sp. XH51]
MTDFDVRERTVSPVDENFQRPEADPAPSQLDVVLDPESNRATVVPDRPEADTTTAWITADVEVLVDVTEMQ